MTRIATTPIVDTRTEDEITAAVEEAISSDLSPEAKRERTERAKKAAGRIIAFFQTGPQFRLAGLVRGLVSNYFKGMELSDADRREANTVDKEFSLKVVTLADRKAELLQEVSDAIDAIVDASADLDHKSVMLPGGFQAKMIAMDLLGYRPTAKLRNADTVRALSAFSGIKVDAK